MVQEKKLKTKKRTGVLDGYVGRKVKAKREEFGMAQNKLAEILGITFQQLQKYEKGVNRISAVSLYKIAKTFGVPIDSFFEGAEKPMSLKDSSENSYVVESRTQEETDKLVDGFFKIKSRKTRRKVLDLMKALKDD